MNKFLWYFLIATYISFTLFLSLTKHIIISSKQQRKIKQQWTIDFIIFFNTMKIKTRNFSLD